MARSREDAESRRSELLAELTEIDEELEQAIEEAVETAVESVGDGASEAAETAQQAEAAAADAATEAEAAAEEGAEQVTEAVEQAVEQTPGVESDHFEEVYSRTLNRLREEGHLPTPDPEQALAAPDAVVEVVQDEIAPRHEHGWMRTRRFLGREW